MQLFQFQFLGGPVASATYNAIARNPGLQFYNGNDPFKDRWKKN